MPAAVRTPSGATTTAAAPAGFASPGGVAVHPAPAVAAFTKYLAPEVVFGWGALSEADIGTLATTTLGDACLSTNPRDADSTDIAALFRSAL